MTPGKQVAFVNKDHDLHDILSTRDHVIVLFYASWCPFCVKFLPIFQRNAEKEGWFFVMVQDDQETMAGKYSVEVLPTVLFFDKGLISKRLDGVIGVGLDENQLAEFIHVCPLSTGGSE